LFLLKNEQSISVSFKQGNEFDSSVDDIAHNKKNEVFEKSNHLKNGSEIGKKDDKMNSKKEQDENISFSNKKPLIIKNLEEEDPLESHVISFDNGKNQENIEKLNFRKDEKNSNFDMPENGKIIKNLQDIDSLSQLETPIKIDSMNYPRLSSVDSIPKNRMNLNKFTVRSRVF
jgi:hypothetical protein